MKNIAIIPARGNSKRFLNKNLAYLNGITLVEWSINYALSFKDIINEIYVSTDDLEIKALALKCGVKVIDRPIELSGDYATSVSVLRHCLLTTDKCFDYVFLLQPTNPLRPQNLLREVYKKMLVGGFDSAITISRDFRKLGTLSGNNFITLNYNQGQRSQDLKPMYYENGLLYICKSDFIKKGILLTENNCSFIINHPYASVDIDYKEDLLYAEFILNNVESLHRD